MDRGGIWFLAALWGPRTVREQKESEVIIVTDDNSEGHSCKDKSQRKSRQQYAHHYQYNQLPCEIPAPPKNRKEVARVDFSFMICGECAQDPGMQNYSKGKYAVIRSACIIKVFISCNYCLIRRDTKYYNLNSLILNNLGKCCRAQ